MWQIKRLSDGKPTLVVTYNSTGTLPLAEDTIYLNNWQSGEYLGYFDGTIGAQSGLLSSIGTKTRWMLRKVDGGYAYWAGPEDFTYTGFDNNKVSWNALTGEFTNVSTTTSIYKTQVTAKHKVTGKTATFDVVVNPKAVLLGVVADGHDHSSWLTEAGEIAENSVTR